jgi:hypothetical protein
VSRAVTNMPDFVSWIKTKSKEKQAWTAKWYSLSQGGFNRRIKRFSKSHTIWLISSKMNFLKLRKWCMCLWSLLVRARLQIFQDVWLLKGRVNSYNLFKMKNNFTEVMSKKDGRINSSCYKRWTKIPRIGNWKCWERNYISESMWSQFQEVIAVVNIEKQEEALEANTVGSMVRFVHL